METIVSCCGVTCSECNYYPAQCKGCPEIMGKPYWLTYTKDDICDIYNCCINQHKFTHCGQCIALPCERYEHDERTKSPEENAADYKKQMDQINKT